MRLKYMISWFEDFKPLVESLKPRIETYLKGLEFEPDIKDYRDDSAFDEAIVARDPNLVLVDQNLAEGGKGDKIIKAIRDNDLYTEVVFYSQRETLPSKTQEPLEGVFYAGKDVFEKTRRIIDLTIKKNQDISNIRGMFIAEAIDATEQIEEIISRILKLSGEQRDFFTNAVIQDEFVNEMSKYKIVHHFLTQKIKSINKEIEDSVNDKKDALKELRKGFEKAQGEFKNFQKIIELRNELAHAKPAQNKKNTLTICEHGLPEEKTFGEDQCKKARQLFKKHQENLQQLNDLLAKRGY